jgi:hypothetical protein
LKELLALPTIRALSIAFPAYPNVIAFRAEASSEPPEAAARAVTPEIEYPTGLIRPKNNTYGYQHHYQEEKKKNFI